jgi:hypothetical protein
LEPRVQTGINRAAVADCRRHATAIIAAMLSSRDLGSVDLAGDMIEMI